MGSRTHRGQLVDELLKLTTAAVTEKENLDTDVSRGVNPPDDALRKERQLIHLEAHLDLIARNTVGAELRLDKTAIETKIQNAASTQIPTLYAEVDRPMAWMAGMTAAVI